MLGMTGANLEFILVLLISGLILASLRLDGAVKNGRISLNPGRSAGLNEYACSTWYLRSEQY